jgi:threonine dehydrogenase-like Zn-dependent dehydrogenase
LDIGTLGWIDVPEEALGGQEIRVKNELGVEKHGTMMAFYKGYANERGAWDPDWRIHRAEGLLWNYPIPLGNMQLGEVIEVGGEVSQFSVGDRVFYSGFFESVATLPAKDAWRFEAGMREYDALLLDPAEFALGAIRDGQFRVGDRVIVIGMGAIGLVTIQILKAAGIAHLVAVDPLESRRVSALASGAHEALNPSTDDIPMLTRAATQGTGFDGAIDFSGSRAGLQTAIRSVGYLGRIVCGAFPPPYDAGLDFGGEAHMNRPTLIFSRACSDPNPEYPRWSHRRIQESAVQLIREGKLHGEPVLGPFIEFDQLLTEYPKIASSPELGAKLTVRYS